ncbi:hypothetical protein V2J09_000386 [Rumex salicifolius]
MMSTKNLVKLANKWRRIAAASRKRISLPTSSTASEKGQFVVYTIDERRFALPLSYLESRVVMELLKMAEEEFGSGGDGRITLPCDSAFMEYAISLIQQSVAREMEEALILSLLSDLCSSNSASSLTHMSNERLPIKTCNTLSVPPRLLLIETYSYGGSIQFRKSICVKSLTASATTFSDLFCSFSIRGFGFPAHFIKLTSLMDQCFLHLSSNTLLNHGDGILHESRVTCQCDAAITAQSKLLSRHSKEFFYYSRLKWLNGSKTMWLKTTYQYYLKSNGPVHSLPTDRFKFIERLKTSNADKTSQPLEIQRLLELSAYTVLNSRESIFEQNRVTRQSDRSIASQSKLLLCHSKRAASPSPVMDTTGLGANPCDYYQPIAVKGDGPATLHSTIHVVLLPINQ